MKIKFIAFCVICSILDICFTYWAVCELDGQFSPRYEQNFLAKFLMITMGPKIFLFIAKPLYLLIAFFVLYKFWIPRFKWLYVFLMLMIQFPVFAWLLFFFIHKT